MSTAEPTGELVRRVTGLRGRLDGFLAATRPKKRRLLNTTIVAGSLAAALTAAPAAGGATLTAWLTATLGLGGPSWRLLCGAATVCSVAATVSTQLLKSNNLEERVTRAQGCRARLEALEVGLALGSLDEPQAAAEYLKCVEDAAFLDVA